jgi:eukaryotic-like serine/threonine-protein kinase
MDATSRVGEILDGRYRLDRLLGSGGMGTVYRGTHLAMERDVAIKLLRQNLAGDPVAARRFALEAKATTRIDSPYAMKVFDFGMTTAREYYMVMEYLDGRTAQRELDVDGPMAPERGIHVARQALLALAAAHQVGVLHRDIKPENLLLMRVGDDPDFCKVLDFGVAKLIHPDDVKGTALTREGMVFGTPDFMSPEQACGLALDGRSDVYALAATLFTLLTGRALFTGHVATEILAQHVSAPPPRLTDQRGLHHLHALDKVLQRALAKRPSDRHRDAAELERALAFLTPSRPTVMASQTPTISTSALPATRGTTPESPLGVIERPATVAAPATPFAARQTGYSPRVEPPGEGTRALVRAVTGRRRWPWALAALAVAGVTAGAAWWSRHPRAGAPTPPAARAAARSDPTATPPADAAAGERGGDDRAAASSVAVPSVVPPVVPSVVPSVVPPVVPPVAPAPPAPAAAEPAARSRAVRLREHLEAARAARAGGRSLRQLTEADLALQLSPRHPEALFLAGDALLTSGDLANGCRYLLRAHGRGAAAARARAAACPDSVAPR